MKENEKHPNKNIPWWAWVLVALIILCFIRTSTNNDYIVGLTRDINNLELSISDLESKIDYQDNYLKKLQLKLTSQEYISGWYYTIPKYNSPY